MLRFPAKFAVPAYPAGGFISPVIGLALRNHTTVFTAPSGYLATGQLAAAAGQANQRALWLRAGEEDRDPGILLGSLIQALQKSAPGSGADTLAAMRRQPGPVSGWAPLFATAAREYAGALPDGGVLVLEHAGALAHSGCLELLGAHFLPLLPEALSTVILSHEPLPPGSIPLQAQQFRERDLRAGSPAGWNAQPAGPLPERALKRALALSDGRAGLMDGLEQACQMIGTETVRRSIEDARSLDDLLLRLARAWIATLEPGAARAAQVAVQLRDFHPEMMHSIFAGEMPGEPAWLQPLEDGWLRVLCGWSPPLRVALRARQKTQPNLLLAAAREMERQGQSERAARLYLDLGDYPRAAEVISGMAEQMLNLGQWQTLQGWLEQIPPQVQRDWPWLMVTAGELAVNRKDGPAAQRIFSLSTTLFRQRGSAEGVCQSLLSESVLAAWQSDETQALNLAHAARSEAREAGQLLYQAYANWQIGCLYAASEQYQTAGQFFDECRVNAQQAGAPLVMQLAEQVKAMLAQHLDLAQQSEHFRQTLVNLDAAQQDVARAIQAVLDSPATNLNLLLAERGWARVPLNLKSQAFRFAPAVRAEPNPLVELWQNLMSIFRFPSQASERSESSDGDSAASPAPAMPTLVPNTHPLTAPLDGAPEPPQATAPAAPQAAMESEPGEEKTPALVAYLLGPFQVVLEDQPLTAWSGGRGRTLFQYLLAHHDRPRTREELMAVFWPDAPEKAARNNLNVAVHALRQAARRISTLDVVTYRDGAYRINPVLSLWLDVDIFEQEINNARRHEAAGDLTATIHALETATSMYQDDFLSSDPYEEWTLQTRERLRLVYMEALDRLSSLYFDNGQYATSAALCQRLLARDACREDAHCRLMRCYTQMGERHLALRQYQICADALRAELNTSPSPATLLLFQKIRRQES